MEAVDILVSVVTSTSIIGLVQFLINRHDRKHDRLASIEKSIDELKAVQSECILRVTRGELKDLIRNDPDNVDAILQVAEYYFLELDGDAYAHSIFEKWAKEHDVQIGWLYNIQKGAKHGNKT